MLAYDLLLSFGLRLPRLVFLKLALDHGRHQAQSAGFFEFSQSSHALVHFTFAVREFDAAFHTLDAEIVELARSIPGYLGEEAWESPSTGLISNVYYWDSMEALQTLVRHPAHIEAKRRQAQWLNGYQVVIAEVVGTYGEQGIAHLLRGCTQPLDC